MAVAYVDQTVGVWSTAQTNPTIEHTVPAGDDRYLLLVCGWKYAAPDATGATYDGDALTFLGTSTDPGNVHGPQVFLYGKALGSSGSPTTADAVATLSGNTWQYAWVVVVNLTGVDQADPTGAFESDGVDNKTISVDITTDTASSLLFGAGGVLRYQASITQDDGQTERWDTDTGDTNVIDDCRLWGSQLAAATAQLYSFGVTKTPAVGYNFSAIAVVEVHEAAAGTTHEAAASVAGAGSISADGVLTLGAAASVAGAGSVSATAGVTRPGAAVAAGAGSATGTAQVTTVVEGAAVVAGEGTSTGTAALTLGATASVAGAGSISADAVLTIVAAASVAGAGTATSTAALTLGATASVAGAGSVTGAAVLTLVGAAAVAGEGSATGTADVTSTVDGAALAAGAGTSTGTAAMTFGGAGLAAGVGAVAAAAVLIIVAAASVAGAGSVSATASVTEKEVALEAAEPYAPKSIRFAGDTVETLREELNRVFAELAERFETDLVVTKSVQFIPVRGPLYKGDVAMGTMFVRQLEYDTPGAGMVLIALPHSTYTKFLATMDSGTAGEDADGNTLLGGLHDD